MTFPMIEICLTVKDILNDGQFIIPSYIPYLDCGSWDWSQPWHGTWLHEWGPKKLEIRLQEEPLHWHWRYHGRRFKQYAMVLLLCWRLCCLCWLHAQVLPGSCGLKLSVFWLDEMRKNKFVALSLFISSPKAFIARGLYIKTLQICNSWQRTYLLVSKCL